MPSVGPQVRRRIATIMQGSLTAVLQPLGFVKRGLVFEKKLDQVSWLVDLQLGRYSTPERTDFTLNYGVYVPGLMAIYSGHPEPSSSQVPYCTIWARAGVMGPTHRDHWWVLDTDRDPVGVDDEIIADLRMRLTEHMLPFLRRIRTLGDVASYLQMLQAENDGGVWPRTAAVRLAYLAILHHMLDQDREREKTLEQATHEAQGGPLETHVRTLRSRLMQLRPAQ